MGNEEHMQFFHNSHFFMVSESRADFSVSPIFLQLQILMLIILTFIFGIYLPIILITKLSDLPIFFSWDPVQIFLANFCISYDYFLFCSLFFDFKYISRHPQSTHFILNVVNISIFTPKPNIRPKFSMIF